MLEIIYAIQSSQQPCEAGTIIHFSQTRKQVKRGKLICLHLKPLTNSLAPEFTLNHYFIASQNVVCINNLHSNHFRCIPQTVASQTVASPKLRITEDRLQRYLRFYPEAKNWKNFIMWDITYTFEGSCKFSNTWY